VPGGVADPVAGANVGVTQANDFPLPTDDGQPVGDHASSRTDPDDVERLTLIYGSELAAARDTEPSCFDGADGGEQTE
jgi:hypothetical protein